MKARSYERFAARLTEIGLFNQIAAQARQQHITVRELYEGSNRGAPSVNRARKAIYAWLRDKKGKGNNEIARLFDRAPSGIARMLKK